MNNQPFVLQGGLRQSIAKCKTALPLPELWKCLGMEGEPRTSCHSPFRIDSTASFSVWQHGEQWFWRDHALDIGGDEVDFIMMAKGWGSEQKREAIELYHQLAGIPLPEKAPSHNPDKKPLGRAIAVYDYFNAKGELVHQTLRYEPKRFLQRRPAVEGMRQGGRTAKRERHTDRWWLWTLDGVEPVLYRLPQLVTSDPSLPVFIVEGEKDADNLAQNTKGYPVTTAPMGAGKWRKSYTETLNNRDVIIVPDRDVKKCPATKKISAGETTEQQTFRCEHCQGEHPVTGMRHALRMAEELKANGGASRVRLVDWNKAWPDAASDGGRKLDTSEVMGSNPNHGVTMTDKADQALKRFLDSAFDYVSRPQQIAVQGDYRPRVLLPGRSGRLLDDFARDLAKELHEKPIFNRGGIVLVLEYHGERARLVPINGQTFRSWIERAECGGVVCQGWVGRGEKSHIEDQTLSKEGADGVLASPTFLAGLRQVARINLVRQPIMRTLPDGSKRVELLEPGYDPETKIFTIDSVDYDEEMPIEEAIEVLEKWFQDTAFNPNDRLRSLSVATAMMLATFCDCMFHRFVVRPAFIVAANTEGAGKTLLASLAIAPVFGPTKLTPPPCSNRATSRIARV